MDTAEVKEMANTQTPMPEYQSHKRVWALKIKEIQLLLEAGNIEAGSPVDDAAIITPAEFGYAPFIVNRAYVAKHNPQVGGYFVLYKDGYKSWSPAQAFEDGYSRGGPPPQQANDERDIMPVLSVFGYRQLNEVGKTKAEYVGHIFSESLRALERCCPPGREFSLVRTKLEEASMWAKKAVSVDPRYQV